VGGNGLALEVGAGLDRRRDHEGVLGVVVLGGDQHQVQPAVQVGGDDAGGRLQEDVDLLGDERLGGDVALEVLHVDVEAAIAPGVGGVGQPVRPLGAVGRCVGDAQLKA